jgi:predicted AAA+ superfamily ATPase
VYLELRRRGYQVYIGKVDDLEVDFVAMNSTGLTYFQVSATVRDAATLDREIAPLKKISDHYPKIILTLDDDPDTDYNGIRRINALDWLKTETWFTGSLSAPSFFPK